MCASVILRYATVTSSTINLDLSALDSKGAMWGYNRAPEAKNVILSFKVANMLRLNNLLVCERLMLILLSEYDMSHLAASSPTIRRLSSNRMSLKDDLDTLNLEISNEEEEEELGERLCKYK